MISAAPRSFIFIQETQMNCFNHLTIHYNQRLHFLLKFQNCWAKCHFNDPYVCVFCFALFCSVLLNVVALCLLECKYTIGQAVINHHCCQWTKIQQGKAIECLGLQSSSGFWMTMLINNVAFIGEFVYALLMDSAQVCALTVYLCHCLRYSVSPLLWLREAEYWIWIKTVIKSS